MEERWTWSLFFGLSFVVYIDSLELSKEKKEKEVEDAFKRPVNNAMVSLRSFVNEARKKGKVKGPLPSRS